MVVAPLVKMVTCQRRRDGGVVDHYKSGAIAARCRCNKNQKLAEDGGGESSEGRQGGAAARGTLARISQGEKPQARGLGPAYILRCLSSRIGYKMSQLPFLR
jgi:hypothetical protein